MSNVNRDMEIPRKNKKEKAEMKNTFDGLISGLDTSKESISELKNMSVRRRQWQPTSVLWPGKSHRWRSLVGCSPWGLRESDMTETTYQQQHAVTSIM